jgi:PAS domain S-box-containing protein
MATILIIDDRPVNRELLRTLLRYKNHTVMEAGDGAEALRAINAEHPDLVISDILMPTMDGYEFVRRLRSDETTAAIPVIFSTAHYLDREAIALARACGVTQTISKPLEADVVWDAVDTALGLTHEPVAPPISEPFDHDHVQLLTDQLARKADELRRTYGRLSALIELGHQVAGERNPLSLLENFCHAARSIIGARYSAIAVLDESGENLQHFLTSGIEPELAAGIGALPVGQGLLGYLLKRGDALRARSIKDHPLSAGFPPNHPPMTSFLGAPISSSSGLYGALYLTDKVGLEEFSEDDEKLVRMLVAQVGIAYENAMRFEQLRRRAAELQETVLQRERAEEELREANQTLQSLVQTSPLAIIALDLDGNVRSWNNAAERIFGWTESEVIGRRIQIIPDDEWDGFYNSLDITRQAGMFTGFETTRMRKDNSLIEVSVSAAPLVDGRGNISGSVVVIADITERKHLEEQFRQAQKMEAVGRLAGGVAHDFNNLLTAIIGYSQLALARLHHEDPMRREIEEIEQAGQRAAGLTNQLLAFSRRQVLQPQVLNLNDVVANLGKMLERLIGEDIVLVTTLAPDIGFVKADRGQIEQIIMNLAVNSRDAMPDGGRLTIETFNADLDESYTSEHIDARPGPHVVLAISDNGCGIDKETQSNVFEPFFTTKEQGKGTGLGLSTVYGIVQQSGGHIGLYSEPGKGTTFKVYLPRLAEAEEKHESGVTEKESLEGSETVLLVEDEDSVRQLARRILEVYGYTVLPASGRDEALAICKTHNGNIDLMLTDVVMPGTSGRELAQLVAADHPEITVLYMSGYTDDAIVQHGVLGADTAFLQKPFAPMALARKVRETIEKKPPVTGDIND